MKTFIVDWWYPAYGLTVYGWDKIEAEDDAQAEHIASERDVDHIVWRVTEEGAYKSAKHANAY